MCFSDWKKWLPCLLLLLTTCLYGQQAYNPPLTLEALETQNIANRRNIPFRYNLDMLLRAFMSQLGERLERQFDLRYCHTNIVIEGQDIIKVGFDFNNYHGLYTVDRARALIKNIGFQILMSMQEDLKLRPYFPIFPVPPSILEISITFNPTDCKTYPFPGNVGYLLLSDSTLRYESVTPETYALHKYYVEPLVLPARYY